MAILRSKKAIDIFPRTNGSIRRSVDINLEQSSHVETVVLLSKLREAKHHVNVKLDMDELDLTSAEAKATYKEIQDWVQEKSTDSM